MKHHPHPKTVSNWIMDQVLRGLNERKIEIGKFPVSPENVAGLLTMVEAGTISARMAKDIFLKMTETGKSASEIVDKRGLTQISDRKELSRIVDQVLTENRKNVKM